MFVIPGGLTDLRPHYSVSIVNSKPLLLKEKADIVS